MSKFIRDTLAVADPHIVKFFTEHLIAAFEAFIDEYPGTVDYVDGFMAAHNFHKAIVGHLVSETGSPYLWELALDTFAEAIGRQQGKGK